MGTYTTRTGLYKADGSENVDVTKVNAAFDIIDAGVGATVCTSSTRPSSPFSGRLIYETNTGKLLANAGTSASPSWADPVANALAGAVSLGSTLATAGAVNVTVAASSSSVYTSAITGDTQKRFTVNAQGNVSWGPGGSTAADTNLYRSSANRLKTDDTFEAVGGVVAGDDSSVAGNLSVTGTATLGGVDLPSTSWTPTWANVTQGTGAVNEGYYLDLGDWIIWQFRLQFGTSPSFSSTIQINLPAAAWTGGGVSLQATLGSWTFRDTSAGKHYAGSIGIWSSAGTSASFNGAWDSTIPNSRITNAIPVTVAVDDVLSGGGIYKKA